MKRGKKYAEAAKLVDRTIQYDPADAVALVKKTAVAKFDETIEAHIRTGCDGRHADQQIRGAVVLPHGTGKTVRVLVFAKNAKADEAQAAGDPENPERRLAGLRRGRRDSRHDGRGRPSGPRVRPQGPDAQPQGGNRHHGCGKGYRRYQSR